MIIRLEHHNLCLGIVAGCAYLESLCSLKLVANGNSVQPSLGKMVQYLTKKSRSISTACNTSASELSPSPSLSSQTPCVDRKSLFREMSASNSDAQNGTENSETKSHNSQKDQNDGIVNTERLDWAGFPVALEHESKNNHRRKPSNASEQKDTLDDWRTTGQHRERRPTLYFGCPVFEDSDLEPEVK